MKYRKELHKYTLCEDRTTGTGIKGHDIDTQFIKLSPDGELLLRTGYQSDGPSGPTPDYVWTIPGAFDHDAGYDLIQMGLLPMECKETFDALAYWRWLKDGYTWAERQPVIIRSILKKLVVERQMQLWYNAVYYLGKPACEPKNLEPILEAP